MTLKISKSNSAGFRQFLSLHRSGLRSCLLLLAAASTAVFIAGCSRQVDVDSEWEESVDRDQSFSRILVVGVSHYAGARCDFEAAMVSQLRATIEAKSSCNLMSIYDPLTRENIETVIADYKPDAVLATSLVRSALGTEEGGSSDTRGGLDFKATGAGYDTGYYGGYGVYGVPVVYGEFKKAPVVTTIEGEITIQSMLYRTKDASLVYELTTSASDLHSRDDAAATITEPIAERLRDDGLIP